jgi:hypothetical protein
METTPSIVLFRGLLSSKIEQLAGKTAGDLNFFCITQILSQSISSKFHHQLKDQAISISPPEYSHLRKYIAAMEMNTRGISWLSMSTPQLILKP